MIPSLQDIARMPLPASEAAMRRFYIPDWKRDEQRPAEMESLFARREAGPHG